MQDDVKDGGGKNGAACLGGLSDDQCALCVGGWDGTGGVLYTHLTSTVAERWRICNHLYSEEWKAIKEIR